MFVNPFASGNTARTTTPVTGGPARNTVAGTPASVSNAVPTFQRGEGIALFSQQLDGRTTDDIRRAATAGREAQAQDPMVRKYQQDFAVACAQVAQATRPTDLTAYKPMKDVLAALR